MPYTPGQVSEMLSIPPSTLRRLSHAFTAVLSKQAGRQRRYSEGDINTLRQIRSMTGQGMTLEAVHQALPVVEVQPPTSDGLALVPSIAAELARVEEYSRSVLGELEKFRVEWQADHERLARLEAWASLPGWRRLFTPPPK